ncbi:TGS domain-containing protein [Candidatus Aerophobetes bacterium]|uniref:TGS domain-containing protein n=1 Tax=Aerophobetes bacterium TaxID=2030807 RepID=A0A523TDH6_UNCAE|nr:MAG: TGS domain-containing protein [Candidatus Aerophobetes bacterium]
MPANLPPQYYEAERRYRLVKTNQERLAILKEMWAIMPKHKGTDKLQADLKAKISRLKREMQKKTQVGKSTYSHHIAREGAAQVVLLGPSNVGKSQILASLTDASPQVAPYPFTTRDTVVGMMKFENINIQLVDTPPITREYMEPWLSEIIRETDLVLLTADLGRDSLLEDIEAVVRKLEESKIKLVAREPEVKVTQEMRYKRAIVGANKRDLPNANKRLKTLKDVYSDKFPIYSLSATSRAGLDHLKEKIYKALNIIRVYTKSPGKGADRSEPIILKKGSRVIDAARAIHKDFANKLRYARMWGSGKFEGQKVQKDHPLEDGDILEFHI